jgi:outer membrane lipoprotein
MQRNALIVVLATAAATAGCATTPLDRTMPPPNQTVADIGLHLGREVTWGGLVVETTNFERYSEIEVLAFPLDRRSRPRPGQLDEGRFVVLRHGFLDPGIYAPGRFITVTGRINGDRRGHLRQAPYVWPELDATEILLWPTDFQRPPVRFSIGVGVGVRL